MNLKIADIISDKIINFGIDSTNKNLRIDTIYIQNYENVFYAVFIKTIY